ncbi:MAG: MFS transporter, partial [Sphingobacteriaceae bacterium]
AIMATVSTLAGDLYNIQERAKIQGWLSSVWGVSAIAGPALGGAFAEYLSWHWIFLINLPLGAVSIGLIYVFLHEQKPRIIHKIKFMGAASMLLSSALLMFGLLQGGQAWPWMSWNSLTVFGLAILSIVITIRLEGANPEPVMPQWIWKNRVLLGTNIALVGMGMTMMAPSMYLPVYAQSVTGVSPMAAGFILASMSLTWPLFSAFSGRLYLSIGFRNTALVGICFAIMGIALFLFLPFPGPVWMLVGSQLLMGAGFGLISTPLMVGVQSVVAWNKRGVVTGASMFSRYFGQTLGTALLAAVFNAVLLYSFQQGPSGLEQALPETNQVIASLQSSHTPHQTRLFLQESFHSAIHYVYFGLLIAACATSIVLLFTPSRFQRIDDE